MLSSATSSSPEDHWTCKGVGLGFGLGLGPSRLMFVYEYIERTSGMCLASTSAIPNRRKGIA